MPRDDKERSVGLPPRVERAFARARAAVLADRDAPKSGRWLAAVPVSVAMVMFAILMPRASPPSEVPLPDVDMRSLSRTISEDGARAARARETRLPGDILAVGSAVRAINQADARGASELEAHDVRSRLDDAVAKAFVREGASDDMLALRALELEGFLAEARSFEKNGEESRELAELGGGFVRRMREATWIDGHRILASDVQLRAAYKLVWNALTGTDRLPSFHLSLDEERVLYALYLARPHAPDARRLELAAELGSAATRADCERARANHERAVELWRAEKIRKLGQIDPSYPTNYALGVAYFRAGRYDLAVEGFRSWLDAHPEGRWSLRARNHLRASVAAYGPF